MGLLSIYEMMQIIRKSFLKVLAASMAIGILAYFVAGSMQTYTCVLGFKYNHTGALEGLAPDGERKLDPYEIQNPVVIQSALSSLGMEKKDGLDVKGIRQNISIEKVVTELDSEVSESAALLGEKYEAPTTEFEMRFTYKHGLGDEFGAKMFSAIIGAYDEFLLDKYYGKSTVADFAKIVSGASADYIDIADIMGQEIDDTAAYLEDLAAWHPDFRSKTTGYSFGELAALYTNLRNIQHAKYYGNIRAGNLAKDAEMVIKSYQTKVKELSESRSVSEDVAEHYKTSISRFYDSYKAAGLYRQAENVQSNTDSSNNRDQDVLYDYDVAEFKNTYDRIVTSYVDNAINASSATHSIDYYTAIIDSFANDTVPAETKARLLSENEKIFEEVETLSARYCSLANASINELFGTKVTTDLEYLIAPEVVADVPVKTVTVFITILAFGGLLVALLFIEFAKRFAKHQAELAGENGQAVPSDKKELDETKLDELEAAFYAQYQEDFSEFFLVYQDMLRADEAARPHKEVFIRWKSPSLGAVPPGRIIECASRLGLFHELNAWIVESVCRDIVAMREKDVQYPVIHINCPRSELSDFKINDILIANIEKTGVPADSICLELSGHELSAYLEEIMLVKQMGIAVCVDRFENSDENNEIIRVIEPEYVKMSLDILHNDMYATSKEDRMAAAVDMLHYLADVVQKCHEKKIRVCICGVEDKAQDNIVSMLDFDFRQGFYYAKPKQLFF